MPSNERLLLALLAGCTASGSPSPTWTTSTTVLAASESRPAGGSFGHRIRLGSRSYASEGALDGFLMTTSLEAWGN